MTELISLIKELLSGNHLWNYNEYLAEKSPQAIATKDLVEKLEKAIKKSSYPETTIHVEMHGGLIEKVYSPKGFPVKSLVFYTNSNDFDSDEQYEEQISTLYEMIADAHGNDELVKYYRAVQRENKLRIGLPVGPKVYVQTESEYAAKTYVDQLCFYGDITQALNNDLFLVEDSSNGLCFVVHLDDINPPESQTM